MFYDSLRVFQLIHLPLSAIRNMLSRIEAVFYKARLNACPRKYVYFPIMNELFCDKSVSEFLDESV